MSSRAKRGIYCLSLAALLCAFAAPAPAAGEAEAHFHWQLGFGADSLETSYGLSLGYAGGEHFAPLSRVVELSVTPQAALASIAGMPLAERRYQANQSQGDAAYEAGVDSRPWYARPWIYWTAGGLAATAALLGTAGSAASGGDGHGSSTADCSKSGGCGIQCTNGTCVVPCPGNFPDSCTVGSGLVLQRTGHGDQRVDEDAFPETPTGGMGDL